MGRMPLLLVAFVVVVVAGCAAGKQASTEETEVEKQNKAAAVAVTSARVFVDGDDKGPTPSTIYVRRGFGEHLVSLRVGNEVVRSFELERAQTSNQNDLVYSFRGDTSEGIMTYDLMDLNQKKDGTYIIPFFESRVQVEDRKFGLTLVVGN